MSVRYAVAEYANGAIEPTGGCDGWYVEKEHAQGVADLMNELNKGAYIYKLIKRDNALPFIPLGGCGFLGRKF